MAGIRAEVGVQLASGHYPAPGVLFSKDFPASVETEMPRQSDPELLRLLYGGPPHLADLGRPRPSA